MARKKPTLDPKLLALAEAKLATSGLTLDDAQKLHIDVLSRDQTAALGYPALASLRLNYLDPAGEPLRTWPRAEPFYRLRFLERPAGADLLPDKKELRYTQPAGVPCGVYFPQSVDWLQALPSGQAILITEGELKAACACSLGYLCLGLGGVFSFQALRSGLELLPELEGIPWLGRHVYICFDSDYTTNPMVCDALRQLAEALIQRGAYTYVVQLPVLEQGKKCGLDDLLVEQGPASLDDLLARAAPLGLTRPLFDLNDRYVYVQDPGLVVSVPSFGKVSPAAFRDHLEAPKIYQERTLKPDGTVSHAPVSAAGAWLGWPMRSTATRLTYQPGAETRLPTGELNSWPGWGVQPKKGDVKPWLKLIDHLFQGAEPEAKRWFLDWCAWPLQHPGDKMFGSAVLHGRRTGTGKSAVGYTLGRIYGKNFVEISQADLHGGFNEWAEGKQLVMGDDVTGSNKRQDADVLKKLITQKELRVNVKYVPSFVIPDCLNYLFTSNHADVFFLEDDDRRFFIHEVLAGPLEQDFYRAYFGTSSKPGWLDSGGAAAVFQWALDRDLSKFDPKARVFDTAAKRRMVADTQSDLGGWCRGLAADPDQVLRLGEIKLTKDLYSSTELLQLYDPSGKTGTTANGLGRELKRAGLNQVLQGLSVRTVKGLVRLYAVRNAERWLLADAAQVQAHLLEAVKPVKKKF